MWLPPPYFNFSNFTQVFQIPTGQVNWLLICYKCAYLALMVHNTLTTLRLYHPTQWLPHLWVWYNRDNPIVYISMETDAWQHAWGYCRCIQSSLQWKMEGSEARYWRCIQSSLQWKMKGLEARWHVFLIAEDFSYQGSSTLVSDITDQ